MKLLKIDGSTILIQKKQTIVTSICLFLCFVVFFAAFLYCISASIWFGVILNLIGFLLFGLKFYGGSSFYELKQPPSIEMKIFQIKTKDEKSILYVGLHQDEAELFAEYHQLNVDTIEIISNHAYSFLR
jgi:energy-coupling factor transporter transmembrane protein EcfT